MTDKDLRDVSDTAAKYAGGGLGVTGIFTGQWELVGVGGAWVAIAVMAVELYTRLPHPYQAVVAEASLAALVALHTGVFMTYVLRTVL